VDVRPFLLDRWLNEHQFSTPPIEFDLAASTGPKWTWRELLSRVAPDTLERALDSSVSYGPATGSPELREAIAEMAGVSPAEVVVVTGASEALWMLLLVAAESSANVVLPYPGYPTFDEAARLLRLEARHYRVRAANQHEIDVDELDACIDERTALVIVNTPHNPTGAVVPDAQLVRLHELAVERGTQLVVDEVYHPIYHGPPSSSAARLPGATTVGDLSKALCLSGLRIGWIIDHDRSRVEQYEDARSYLTISSSPLGEVLAEAAVRARDQILSRARTVTETNLATLDAFLDAHGDQLAWVRPAGGMTAFPWLRSGTDARPLCVDAAAAGVLVAPGDCFGLPAYVRIGFGATEHGFPEAIDRLADVLRRRG
jgi:aspartate/methionine/tyrosine aminotransferase